MCIRDRRWFSIVRWKRSEMSEVIVIVDCDGVCVVFDELKECLFYSSRMWQWCIRRIQQLDPCTWDFIECTRHLWALDSRASSCYRQSLKLPFLLVNTRSPEALAAADIYLHISPRPASASVCLCGPPPIYVFQPLLSDECLSTCSTGSLAGSVSDYDNNIRCKHF